MKKALLLSFCILLITATAYFGSVVYNNQKVAALQNTETSLATTYARLQAKELFAKDFTNSLSPEQKFTDYVELDTFRDELKIYQITQVLQGEGVPSEVQEYLRQTEHSLESLLAS